MNPDGQILASSEPGRENAGRARGSSALTSTAEDASSADSRRWLTLVILLLAAFMNLLDGKNSL